MNKIIVKLYYSAFWGLAISSLYMIMFIVPAIYDRLLIELLQGVTVTWICSTIVLFILSVFDKINVDIE